MKPLFILPLLALVLAAIDIFVPNRYLIATAVILLAVSALILAAK